MTKTHRLKSALQGPAADTADAGKSAAQRERELLMDTFGIRHEGAGYTFDGHHYEQLPDAVSHARLIHLKPHENP